VSWKVWIEQGYDILDSTDIYNLIALIPLSMNATGICVGNGQLAMFILPLLIAVLSLARTAERGWRTDLSIILLFLLALVKPTFSAPFFLVLMLVYLVVAVGRENRELTSCGPGAGVRANL